VTDRRDGHHRPSFQRFAFGFVCGDDVLSPAIPAKVSVVDEDPLGIAVFNFLECQTGLVGGEALEVVSTCAFDFDLRLFEVVHPKSNMVNTYPVFAALVLTIDITDPFVCLIS